MTTIKITFKTENDNYINNIIGNIIMFNKNLNRIYTWKKNKVLNYINVWNKKIVSLLLIVQSGVGTVCDYSKFSRNELRFGFYDLLPAWRQPSLGQMLMNDIYNRENDCPKVTAWPREMGLHFYMRSCKWKKMLLNLYLSMCK